MMGEEIARRGGNPGSASNIEKREKPHRNATRPQRQVVHVATASGRRQGMLFHGKLGWLTFCKTANGFIQSGGYFKTRTAAMAAVRRMAEA
jgi:hypothetical protein